MSFTPENTTLDDFLGGRLRIRQPKSGYRAATDPVFLAAATEATGRQSVLELGCGVGVASFCLAKRVPDVSIVGLELQPEYAELACKNAEDNEIAFDVHVGDLTNMPPALRTQSFDHVIANPPFFDKGSIRAPRDEGKATAHVIETDLPHWIDAGLRRLKPNGVFTIIQLAQHLDDILKGLSGRTGAIEVLPLASRWGRPAKRVLVRGRKGRRAPLKLLSPFHVHAHEAHVQGVSDFTPEADAILREGASLNWR